MAGKFRFSRLGSSVDAALPPPLPLIHLPDEVRQANTGVPGLRPAHLPVRHHLVESRAAREPEPILRESRALVEMDAEENETREVVARLRVYEYNQPEVFQNAGAPDDTLVFDALFESGNLQRAERIYRREGGRAAAARRHEYELTIHPDVRNSAYRQWFYFEVRNGTPGVTYQFLLANLAKSGALFGSGLQPVVYSDVDARTNGVGWVHRGTHVRYDAALAGDSDSASTCLSFQYEFAHEGDRVYFACLQPYTYTDLTEYLDALERDPERAAVCRRTELCQTIAQNACDLLTITSSGKDGVSPEEKRAIVLSARVHPGEPNSSWMMKGMIDYLVGASSGARVLRRHFVFKVVPMLNPDGVVNGNTRVNLAGADLNRKWAAPLEQLFPTVFHLKRQLASLQARDRVAIFCDLHGHSLSRNIFTYGCYNKKGGGGGARRPMASVKNDPRVFPMVVAANSPFFSFASCDFRVHKSKLSTARVVANHELGVINSYTLEASFCGPDFGARKDTQFSTADLEDMGASWCRSLLVYFDLVAEVAALDAVPAAPAVPVVATSSLLNDCEAAVSELLADLEVGDDDASLDSELSGAEDDAIPPVDGLDVVADDCSSAWEDGGEQSSPGPRDLRRRAAGRARKLLKKNGKRGTSGKGKRAAAESEVPTAAAAVPDLAPVVRVKPKAAKSKRCKRQSDKKQRPVSRRRSPAKAAAASDSADDDGDEEEEEEEEEAEAAVTFAPLTSS